LLFYFAKIIKIQKFVLKKKGAAGFDIPGQDINCGPSSDASPDQCKSKCQSTPQCTHYTWFYRDNQQNCCIKYGWRSYLSQVFRLDLSPIVSEIL